MNKALVEQARLRSDIISSGSVNSREQHQTTSKQGLYTDVKWKNTNLHLKKYLKTCEF